MVNLTRFLITGFAEVDFFKLIIFSTYIEAVFKWRTSNIYAVVFFFLIVMVNYSFKANEFQLMIEPFLDPENKK